MKKLVNGVEVTMTAAEEAAFLAQQQAAQEQQAEDLARQAEE